MDTPYLILFDPMDRVIAAVIIVDDHGGQNHVSILSIIELVNYKFLKKLMFACSTVYFK